jgi:flagellar basal body P-ring formation protein FlgA
MNRLLSISLMLWCAGAVAGPAAFELKPQAQVTSAGVFLADVVANTDSTIPELLIAPPPKPGQTLTLNRAHVEAALMRLSDAPVTNCFAGPVRVTRRTRTLDEDEVKLLITAQLQETMIKDRGELELRFARAWTAISVPDEELKLRVVEMPNSGVSPLFICRFELATTNETVGTWQASFHAKVWRDVWVSRAPLRRGSSLADAELTRERRDVLTLRDAPVDFEAVDPGLETAEYVAPNVPILVRSLKLKPAVRRGQTAMAMVVDGVLSVSMKVEVLEDGVPGQSIRIRNPQTKRELRGKVQNEETILVSL